MVTGGGELFPDDNYCPCDKTQTNFPWISTLSRLVVQICSKLKFYLLKNWHHHRQQPQATTSIVLLSNLGKEPLAPCCPVLTWPWPYKLLLSSVLKGLRWPLSLQLLPVAWKLHSKFMWLSWGKRLCVQTLTLSLRTPFMEELLPSHIWPAAQPRCLLTVQQWSLAGDCSLQSELPFFTLAVKQYILTNSLGRKWWLLFFGNTDKMTKPCQTLCVLCCVHFMLKL